MDDSSLLVVVHCYRVELDQEGTSAQGPRTKEIQMPGRESASSIECAQAKMDGLWKGNDNNE
jgi:hypothetical protein